MWDPKVYFFHNGPLKNTDAALEEVILACESALGSKRKQGEPPPGWAMIAVHVDDLPGVATSTEMIEFILDTIRVVYACEMVPWKKVLGFKVVENKTTIAVGVPPLLGSSEAPSSIALRPAVAHRS